MTTLYTANYLKVNPTDGSPMEFVNSGDVKGQGLWGFDEYTFLAETVIADIIQTHLVLPIGARLLGVSIECPNSGSSAGTFTVNAGATIVRTAANTDPGAADVNSYIPAFHENTSGVEEAITLVAPEATDSNTGTTLKIAIHYIVV